MTLNEATARAERPVAGPRRGAGRSLPLTVVLIAVLVGGMVALLSLVAVHVGIPNSDGATVVLEGQSMSAGHLTLHGWALSLDSFWTVDALFSTLVVLIAGVKSSLLYIAPALIAVAVIVVGAWMAREGRRGVAGVAAVATVVALLGLPSYYFAVFFLQGPWHVGTALWCLIVFAGLRRGRFGWGWALAVVFMALGILGDFQMLVIGMTPAFAAGLIAMLRTRGWRQGLPAASAPIAGALLAVVLRVLALIVGTFTISASNATASRTQMRTNVKHIVSWGAHMLGVGSGLIGRGGVPAALQAVHIVGLIVVVAGVGAAVVGLIWGAVTGRPGRLGRLGRKDPMEAWRLDDLLVLACVADVGLFVAITVSDDQSYSRYLTAAIIFGVILAGRQMGRLIAAVDSARLLRWAAVVGVAVIGAFAAGVGFNVTAARPSLAYVELGQFLQSHQFHNGIGDYWSASATTVATNNDVTVRPVITDPGGRLVRYQKQSAATWYAGQRFEFLVYDTAVPWGGVNSTTAAATFGSPTRTYPVGTYRVLVWNHPLAVSVRGFTGTAD